MSPQTSTALAYLFALAGLACFLWPSIQRLRGERREEPLGSAVRLRSKLWWTGFVLTALALMLQRMGAQG